MVEVEKGIVNEMYSDIGKEDDEKDTMEDGDKEEMKRVDDIAEWIEVKSSLIYDFESKQLDFGKSKATNWKGNKRIKLPKAKDEMRRQMR